MTQNEVSIIKNSVLDATEAYVDARLSVADFVKTQIGVVVSATQDNNTKKWYHTVRCNATQANPNGIVYNNVLSVNNIHFTDNSVVFVFAPNAQFSNQFILGKLDNVPYDITAGSIHIGKIGNTDNYYFNVDSNGNLNINNVFTATNAGVVSIKKGSISLGKIGNTDNYYFNVDDSGIVTIKNGSILLGATTVSGVNGYNVNINSTGIGLGLTGGTQANPTYNFTVSSGGVVEIKNGSIKLNYSTTISDYGFIVDSSGIKLGAIGTSSSDKDWNFKVNNTGQVTIKSGSINIASKFYVDTSGNLYVGGTTTSNAKFYVTNTGALSATSGSIGGFEITSNSLGDPLNTIGVGMISGDHIYAWHPSHSVRIYNDSIDLDYAHIYVKYGGSHIEMNWSNIESSDKGLVSWEGSDRRYKKNIKDLSLNFSKKLISNLQPREYELKSEKGKRYGFIAQEVREILDNMNCKDSRLEFVTDTGSDMHQLNYNDIIAPLVMVVQDQQKQIDELKRSRNGN